MLGLFDRVLRKGHVRADDRKNLCHGGHDRSGKRSNADILWPRHCSPKHSEEPFFLFLLTPPYSGSTAFAKLLATARRAMLLHHKGEGQWLVPGLCQDDRWDPQKRIDWSSVRDTWLARIHEIGQLVGGIDLIIEKSPPNIVRIDKFLEVFPNHAVITLNRDPYANCASTLKRYFDAENLPPRKRKNAVKRVANAWIDRSQLIADSIRRFGALQISYEDFAEKPEAVIRSLTDKLPILQGVELDRPVEVKGYRPQGISNHNRRQVKLLSKADRYVIADILNEHEGLLAQFGYSADFQTAH